MGTWCAFFRISALKNLRLARQTQIFRLDLRKNPLPSTHHLSIDKALVLPLQHVCLPIFWRGLHLSSSLLAQFLDQFIDFDEGAIAQGIEDEVDFVEGEVEGKRVHIFLK